MAAGLCAAWPFHKSWLAEQDALVSEALSTAAPPPIQPLIIRQPQPVNDEPSPALETAPLPGLHPLASALDRRFEERSLVRIDQRPPIPDLAAGFTVPRGTLDPRSTVLAGNDASPVITSEPVPPRHWRRYRILKHDTLESIAERLLGSRAHANQLLAANADVILVPEVLPVGATIVIPDLSLSAESLVRRPEEEK
jgi:phage tail protein X